MEWRKNRIAVGAVVFVALLALTLWATQSRDRAPASASEVPTVEIDKDTITSLEVTRPKGEPVVLSRVDEAWRVTAPLEAEADQTNVESALNRLADLELVRVVATKPENYERLQVDEANAVRVTVHAGDETLAELAIGKYANGMTMIRIEDRTEVFGASGSLRYAFDRELKAWRNRKVVNADVSKVQAIRYEGPKGTFEFQRAGEGWSTIAGGKQLEELDPKKVTGMVSTAARLIASGFADEDISEARAGLAEPKSQVTITVADEETPIVLELGAATEEGNEVYLRRKGNPTIYVVSEYLSNRLRPDASAFEKAEVPLGDPSAAPAMPQAGGQPQLPPEVMQRLQEQIRAQQRGQ